MQRMLSGFEVMEANPEHHQMMVDGQVVLMREVDCTINLTQIVRLTGKAQNERARILQRFKVTNKVVTRPARGTRGPSKMWASIEHRQKLCVELGLTGKLQPLLDRGLGLRRDHSSEKVCRQ